MFASFQEDEESGFTGHRPSAVENGGTPTHATKNGHAKKADSSVNGTQSLKHMDAKSEAQQIKDLIKDMAKTPEVGSVWYIVSMNWIAKW